MEETGLQESREAMTKSGISIVIHAIEMTMLRSMDA